MRGGSTSERMGHISRVIRPLLRSPHGPKLTLRREPPAGSRRRPASVA